MNKEDLLNQIKEISVSNRQMEFEINKIIANRSKQLIDSNIRPHGAFVNQSIPEELENIDLQSTDIKRRYCIECQCELNECNSHQYLYCIDCRTRLILYLESNRQDIVKIRNEDVKPEMKQGGGLLQIPIEDKDKYLDQIIERMIMNGEV